MSNLLQQIEMLEKLLIRFSVYYSLLTKEPFYFFRCPILLCINSLIMLWVVRRFEKCSHFLKENATLRQACSHTWKSKGLFVQEKIHFSSESPIQRLWVHAIETIALDWTAVSCSLLQFSRSCFYPHSFIHTLPSHYHPVHTRNSKYIV